MNIDSICTDYGLIPILKTTKNIFLLIEIIVPIIAMLMLIKIFSHAVTSTNEKTRKETITKTKNTLLALAIVFFIPVFVNIIMNLSFMKSNFSIAACWDAAESVKLNKNSTYIETSDQEKHSIFVDPDEYEKGKPKPIENNNDNSNNINDEGGTAGLSDKGKVSYLTKNGEKWNLNENIKYSLNQGAASDGKYLYVAFKGDDNHGLIAKFDIEARKLVKKSKVMDLGHANDMTYDFGKQKLFVTREETNDLSISMFDPNTLEGRVVNIKKPSSASAVKAFNGIAYDQSSGQLLIRSRYGNSQSLWVNNNFNTTKILKIRKWFDLPTQGMEIVGNKVIYSQSIMQYRSSVTSYNKKTGKKIKSTQLGVHGELEGVFYYKGDLYGITYDKRGKNKTLVYKINSGNY